MLSSAFGHKILWVAVRGSRLFKRFLHPKFDLLRSLFRNCGGMDKLIHGIVADGSARLFAAVTTGSVTEAVLRHGTSPTTSAALGRMLTGAALLGASLKDFDRLTVRIECDGPVAGITAEATKEGHIRGYIKNPTGNREATAPENL